MVSNAAREAGVCHRLLKQRHVDEALGIEAEVSVARVRRDRQLTSA
ncbi:MAG: hypothetical protein H0U22_02195, partial [Geodermatophilaceae bacterium]|nr:hypothetical protein [Geodermatophilaceae bacterium]